MCSLLLVCADLKTLHLVEHILNEEECRSVGKAGLWWKDELAMTIAVKPANVLQETLGIFEGDVLYNIIPERIKSKLCSTCEVV